MNGENTEELVYYIEIKELIEYVQKLKDSKKIEVHWNNFEEPEQQ